MLTLVRRLASCVAILALCAGNLAACTAWDAAPEARMACCIGDEACQMHGSESHHSHGTGAVSQSQADSCCALSEGRDSSRPASAFVLANALALAPGHVLAILPVFHSTDDGWRTFAPPPRSPVPTHLLLSVFLV